MVVLFVAALTALALFGTLIDFLIGQRHITWLGGVDPSPGGAQPWPAVSIIIAARDEARGIEAALRSVLNLDYAPLEIIVVNDRSSDDTGAILRRLSRDHAQLRVIDITALPSGWLGKNHALAVGAAGASGDLLLFTDADIVFEATTVRRAVQVMEARALDHLTAVPETKVPGVALNAFVAAFGVLFSIYARPWKARDPRSRHHLGIGAFNMVRARAYQHIGTHAAIALRTDDDMRLARLVKAHHLRADVVTARGFLVVEWYASVGEMIDGLMKNAFAGLDYSLTRLIGATVALLAVYVWPWLALFLTGGVAQMLALASVGLMLLLGAIQARAAGTSPLYATVFPLAVLLFVYVMWRSALLALTRGVVVWRGTAYPLADLRAARAALPLAPALRLAPHRPEAPHERA